MKYPKNRTLTISDLKCTTRKVKHLFIDTYIISALSLPYFFSSKFLKE